MKVDTKKMTPISKVSAKKDSPDSCLFHENKYIEDGAAALHGAKDESGKGFWIRFIPTIFYTPVKSSQRHTDKRRETLDAKGVEDLNNAFAKLMIREEEKTEPQGNVEDKDTDADEKCCQESVSKEQKEKLGRFQTKCKIKKSPKKVNVTRSYRLVDGGDEAKNNVKFPTKTKCI